MRYFSVTHLPFIKTELISVDSTPLNVAGSHQTFSPFTLYIGRDTSVNFRRSLFFEIPKRLRPSPLYLIFKDLTGKKFQLDFNNICFRLIDFDAY